MTVPPIASHIGHFVTSHLEYFKTYAENPGDIYSNSSIDKAMKNCYTQTRKFVMARWGLTEIEATTVITQGKQRSRIYSCIATWYRHY